MRTGQAVLQILTEQYPQSVTIVEFFARMRTMEDAPSCTERALRSALRRHVNAGRASIEVIKGGAPTSGTVLLVEDVDTWCLVVEPEG